VNRYLALLVAVVVVGAAIAVVGRAPRAASHAAAPAVAAPAATLALVVENGHVNPARTTVPAGAVVTLTIANHDARTVTVALAGYDDRLAIGALAPRGRWTGRFLADRPGDDFTWSVDGAPAGRFDVTGSHLVEGHR
jgi:hypothetical protein